MIFGLPTRLLVLLLELGVDLGHNHVELLAQRLVEVHDELAHMILQLQQVLLRFFFKLLDLGRHIVLK